MELHNTRKAGRVPRIRIGDIFAVDCTENKTKYFQYVANDSSQLNSRVIRVFRKSFQREEDVDLNTLVKSKVEFFAHVFITVGLKLGYWRKVGCVNCVGKVEIYFRDTNDYGNPNVKVSHNWYVWKINEPFIQVGELEGKYRESEIGVVVAPHHIKERIETGSYTFAYPGFN